VDDDRIIAEHSEHPGAGRGAGESMDVLLQLSLPIVLILALLVSTQVTSLRDRLGELEGHLEAGAAAQLLEQLERSVLDLQLQLLLQASRESADVEARHLGLDEYAVRRPEPGEIAARRIDPVFRATSARLAESFNGAAARRSSRARLNRDVLALFERNARELLASDPESGTARQRRLFAISAENRARLDEDLSGRLNALEAAGVRVQLELVEAWLAAPTGGDLDARSQGVWSRIVAGEEDEIEAFVNLKVRDLVDRLEGVGVPLLDDALAKAL
jgi:hypothetical protein